MGEVKEPYEGGTGSLLEVVDMMCGVTEKLADIVRKQAVLIGREDRGRGLPYRSFGRKKTGRR